MATVVALAMNTAATVATAMDAATALALAVGPQKANPSLAKPQS